MKNTWLILAFLFLIQPVLPVLEYAMNYDYIAEVLCINKENEALQCHGKCHLGKEIAKELGDVDDTKDSTTPSNKIDIQLFFECNACLVENIAFLYLNAEITPYEDSFIGEPHILLFSPPPELI